MRNLTGQSQPTKMNPLSLDQLAQFAEAVRQHGDGSRLVTNVSTDSRTIQPGDLFVALRGENFDGHKFVAQATERGAAGARCRENLDRQTVARFLLFFASATRLAAYQRIAAQYRRSLGLKVIAITGSNGKTSTKDFTASVLGRRFRVTKTEGNFNNHVGLPRTMLQASAQDEIARLGNRDESSGRDRAARATGAAGRRHHH